MVIRVLNTMINTRVASLNANDIQNGGHQAE